MGLAAFVLPERWMVATPLPRVDPAALEALRAERIALDLKPITLLFEAEHRDCAERPGARAPHPGGVP